MFIAHTYVPEETRLFFRLHAPFQLLTSIQIFLISCLPFKSIRCIVVNIVHICITYRQPENKKKIIENENNGEKLEITYIRHLISLLIIYAKAIFLNCTPKINTQISH